MVAPTVFLSFSSHDASLAAAIRDGLLKRDLDVWKAPESIPAGVEWASAIHAGIAQQQVFLLLWSESAMASAEVTKEINLAASLHRRLLLPVRLTTKMPDGSQAYHLAGTQWLEGQDLPVPELVERIETRIHEMLKGGSHIELSSPVLQTRRNTKPKRLLVFKVMLGVVGLLAVAFDLNPWLPANQWLLDQRLFWQARWRQLTNQPGPLPRPIGLLPLGSRVYAELGVEPTDGAVNQAVLARALLLLPASGAPRKVGLDFILDGPGPNPAGHEQLAAAIRRQSGHRQVLAGLCPPNSVATADCLKASDQRLAGPLAIAGAKPVSLTLGLNTETQPPLQLAETVAEGSLAHSLVATAPREGVPEEAVIDWSVNWLSPQRLTVLTSAEALAAYRGQSLLIASDGYKGRKLSQVTDQHQAPRAVRAYAEQGPERIVTLQSGMLTGGVLQTVLAQSIASGHWLLPITPFMNSLTAALIGLATWGWMRPGRRRSNQALGLLVGGLLYVLLALQLAVSLQRLLPLALPMAVTAGIVGIRRARGLR
jgi:hypothetical protein